MQITGNIAVVRLFSVVLALLLSAQTSSTAANSAPLSWRVLLIIKRQTNVNMQGLPPTSGVLAQDNIDVVSKAFSEYTPYWVSQLSNGRLEWKPTVYVSSVPVTTVEKTSPGHSWITYKNIKADIDTCVKTRGQYDGIFVYWQPTDAKTGVWIGDNFGLTIGPNASDAEMGYSCITAAPTQNWSRDSETTEVFMHEWLHQLEAFYGSRGVKLPRGGLHGPQNYGLPHAENGWKNWYRAFINASIKDPDGSVVGLGERAWQLGTISDALTGRQVPGKMGNNLVNIATAEANKTWQTHEWKDDPDAATLQHGRDGGYETVLSTRVPNDIMLAFPAQVTPHRRYLLSALIKPDGVKIMDEGATLGAHLAIYDDMSSSSLTGTSDWTYVEMPFDSGDRTTLEIGPRLGNHGSTAIGTATYRQLRLVELTALNK